MKKAFTYLIISVIIIIEISTLLSGYTFISPITYFWLNGIIIFILIFLLNRKLFSRLSIKIFFGLLICFGFMSLNNTYISHDPNSNSSLIIQENRGFHDSMYTFYKTKFLFFKESLYGDLIVADRNLDIEKSIEFIWLDDTTVKLIPINKSFFEEKTISLNNTADNFTPTF